jgi:hypothetical protein
LLPNLAFDFGTDPRPAQLRALGLGPSETGLDALHDHGPLKLGEDPGHLEEHPSLRGARVHALLLEVEIDVLGLQLFDEVQECESDDVHGSQHRGTHVQRANGRQQRVPRSEPSGLYVAVVMAR